MNVVFERFYFDEVQPHRDRFQQWLQSFTPLQFYSGLFLIVAIIYGIKIWSIVKTQEDFEQNPPQAYLDFLKRREEKLKAKAEAAAAAGAQGEGEDQVPLIQDKKHD